MLGVPNHFLSLMETVINELIFGTFCMKIFSVTVKAKYLISLRYTRTFIFRILNVIRN